MSTYESAERWNASNPPGTRVRVTLRDGSAFDAQTAGYAQQWGEFALLKLRDSDGLWSIRALKTGD